MKARDRMGLFRFRGFHVTAHLPDVHWTGEGDTGVQVGFSGKGLYLRVLDATPRIVRFLWGDLVDGSGRAVRDEPDDEGWTPFEMVERTPEQLAVEEADELWGNSLFTVHLRRDQMFWPVGNDVLTYPLVHLSMHRHDRLPIDDWRHMQRIKDELVGPECEAVELFPAHSRLVDTANEYHLYVVSDPGFRWPFGYTNRMVMTGTEGATVRNAVQRDPSYGPSDYGPMVTKTGRVITDQEIEFLADQAERGYCVQPGTTRALCGHPLPCPRHPEHTHTEGGQTLTHSHEDLGEHGYFGHPEDPPEHPADPTGVDCAERYEGADE